MERRKIFKKIIERIIKQKEKIYSIDFNKLENIYNERKELFKRLKDA